MEIVVAVAKTGQFRRLCLRQLGPMTEEAEFIAGALVGKVHFFVEVPLEQLPVLRPVYGVAPPALSVANRFVNGFSHFEGTVMTVETEPCAEFPQQLFASGAVRIVAIEAVPAFNGAVPVTVLEAGPLMAHETEVGPLLFEQ